MGPRSEDRGEASRKCARTMRELGFNGAAVRRPRREDQREGDEPRGQPLQWGRGPKTAESQFSIPDPRSREPGFNGAAVRRPRRVALETTVGLADANSFNGAAVRRPRRAGTRRLVGSREELASMGPRS